MAYGLQVLPLVQEFCRRRALPVPSAVANSLDAGVRQYVGLLNETLEEILVEYEWTALLNQVSFTTLAQSDQGDIDTICGFPVQYILNDIMWDTDTRLPVFGPVGPSRWEQYKALPITGTLLQYRIEKNRLLFYPLTPPAGHTIILEALQRYAVVDNSGPSPVYKQFFTADTDYCVFPDALLFAALTWRWKREKGLAYAEDQARYDRILSTLKLRDGTGRILNMNGDEENFGPGILVPSGSWNVHGGGLP